MESVTFSDIAMLYGQLGTYILYLRARGLQNNIFVKLYTTDYNPRTSNTPSTSSIESKNESIE